MGARRYLTNVLGDGWCIAQLSQDETLRFCAEQSAQYDFEDDCRRLLSDINPTAESEELKDRLVITKVFFHRQYTLCFQAPVC